MRYVLFGTGDYYQRFRHWFEAREVVAILDNDINKQGGFIDGRPVISPKDITNLDFDAVVILSFYVTEMKNQLIGLGIDASRIFHFYDLNELFSREEGFENLFSDAVPSVNAAAGLLHGTDKKRILLLSHDLSLGGPALALFHAATVLKKAGYGIAYASMIDGELRYRLKEERIPVIVDERLQIGTMKQLRWTSYWDLLICNTINYHVFLADRDKNIPVIWWLHDSYFFYEGIDQGRLRAIDRNNLKVLSVGPVPAEAMNSCLPDLTIDDLIYGVSESV